MALLVGFPLLPGATDDVALAEDTSSFPYMNPDDETFRKWVNAYNRSPRAEVSLSERGNASPGGSLSLLPYLDYVPSERSQGSCGNCWAWAGTGCMEIALDLQEGIHNRLSLQYINSCQTPITGNPCCDGGWLAWDFVRFYEETEMCIPWSNTNAEWQDRDAGCDVACGTISTEPHYDITYIDAVTVPTHTGNGEVPDSEAAIDSIKSTLDGGDAIWFAFFVRDSASWSQFSSFWMTQPETTVCDLDALCSGSTRGPGHAVLCVGYNDDDPENPYWVMLNSWGTAGSLRPNGLFRIDMAMDYDTTVGDSYAFYWQKLEVAFSPPEPPVVSTGSASLVDEMSARLHGTLVDDSGYDSQCRFAYGAVSGGPYDHQTDWQDGLSPGDSFEADVDDLAQGTACYFVAQGLNPGGTGSGDESMFLTNPLPPEDFSAFATGESSASLTWNPGAGAERTYVRGKMGEPPSNPDDGYLVYDGTGTSCEDEGLEPGSKHYYRAWSVAQEPGLDDAWSSASTMDDTTTVGNGIWVEGDVNLDAQTTVVDAMFVAQYTVGLRALDATQLLCGDTTDDGSVNIVDAMHIAQFTVDPEGQGGILFMLLWDPAHDSGLLDPLEQ